MLFASTNTSTQRFRSFFRDALSAAPLSQEAALVTFLSINQGPVGGQKAVKLRDWRGDDNRKA